MNATLFLHLDGRKLSELEWQHSGLASYIAYAIGIARHDTNLMDHAFGSINALIEDVKRLKGVIREIDGVYVRSYGAGKVSSV